jgi:hypothetical protein
MVRGDTNQGEKSRHCEQSEAIFPNASFRVSTNRNRNNNNGRIIKQQTPIMDNMDTIRKITR